MSRQNIAPDLDIVTTTNRGKVRFMMNYLVGRHRCAYGNKRFFLRRVLIAGMTLLPLLLCGIAMAENFTPPPVPEIPPVISDMYPEDADGNLVSDVLEDRMRTAESTSTSAPGLMLRATASIMNGYARTAWCIDFAYTLVATSTSVSDARQ